VPNELKGSLTTLGERAQSMPDTATRVVLTAAQRVVAAAKGPWPVKSGRSRKELAALLRGRQVRIVDPAPYTTRIVSHGVRPWDAYVVQPVRALAAGPLPREIGAALLKDLAKGGRRG